MAPCWLDTHVHMERYTPDQIARMLLEAASAGVEQIVAVSTSMASSRRTLALQGPIIKAIGVHPTRATDLDKPALRELAGLAHAIGEIGFDDGGPAEAIQLETFSRQVAIAHELHLPVLLHIEGPLSWMSFKAHASLLDGLEVVRHYFTGDGQQLAFHVERGDCVSFGRPLLRDPDLQALAVAIPAELLLIETDSYPLPGRTTAPKDLASLGAFLARIRDCPEDSLATQLWENSERIFGTLTRQ